MDTEAKGGKPNRYERPLFVTAIIGSLLLVNVLGLGIYKQLDLTRQKSFTLSQSTHSTLARLREPVTIRAYFTRDLPPPHSSQARYVKDLLEAYYTAGRGKVRFEFIDPMEQASAEDTDKKNQVKQDIFGNAVRESTTIERNLESMGIPPVQVRINQADKVEVKRAYMGIALNYQERREVIPVVADTAGLEYDLTSMLRKLTHEKSPKIGLVRGHSKVDPTRAAGQALNALKEHYELGEVDLTAAGTLLPDVDGLLVMGPQTPFDANERRTLEAFVHAGKGVAFFLPPVTASLQGLETRPNEHGLSDMLRGFGVELSDELVLDAECATINVQQQTGFMRVNQPVRYPYIAQLTEMPDGPLTRGLSEVMMGFAGPLKVIAKEDGPVHAQVLARTSPRSWRVSPPFNLDPMQTWSPSVETLAPQDLMVALSGPMGHIVPDDKAKKAKAKGKDDAPATPPEAQSARVLVAASDAFLQDAMFSRGNQALLLNSIDWMMGDDDLLAVRNRGLASAPLADIGEARRRSLKYGNIVGLPLGFVGLGLVRWRRRQQRRQDVVL